MPSIVIVDPHTSFRQALEFVLSQERDITIAGHVGSIDRLISEPILADVALVDLDALNGASAQVLRRFRRMEPNPVIICLTGSDDPELAAAALENGAAGVLCKTVSLDDMIAIVRRACAGEPLMSMAETIALFREAHEAHERERRAKAALESLSEREREVLACLAEGLADKAIAERLLLSDKTVRTHMVSILAKLGVNSRLQAVIFAIRHGAVKVK